jgi:hypothetical protein
MSKLIYRDPKDYLPFLFTSLQAKKEERDGVLPLISFQK